MGTTLQNYTPKPVFFSLMILVVYIMIIRVRLTRRCFYRPPDSKISTSEEESLDLMPKKSCQTIVPGGDFNLSGIDWDNGVVNLKAANISQCELLLSSLDTHTLTQIQRTY